MNAMAQAFTALRQSNAVRIDPLDNFIIAREMSAALHTQQRAVSPQREAVTARVTPEATGTISGGQA
ncbi:MAG: hypothetical protein JSR70_08565 [Proteobacteria bacterium]|nr:hypothetical protein [Pseudomonadota bacterium]